MAEDLVDRMRKLTRSGDFEERPAETEDLLTKAADEIERLREQVQAANLEIVRLALNYEDRVKAIMRGENGRDSGEV